MTDAGEITTGNLILDRKWMTKQGPLALDIAKSFVAALAQDPDRAIYDEVSRAMWNLRDPSFVQAMQTGRGGDPPGGIGRAAARCVDVFVGGARGASVESLFARLSFENVVHEAEECLDIVFTFW
jgi:hypothetical protein